MAAQLSDAQNSSKISDAVYQLLAELNEAEVAAKKKANPKYDGEDIIFEINKQVEA